MLINVLYHSTVVYVYMMPYMWTINNVR